MNHFPLKRFLPLSATGLAVALSACGSLDSNTDAAPMLATIQGNLVNPSAIDVSPSSDVRVAVIWRGVQGASSEFAVAEDLPVRPLFPSMFTLTVTEPPPASVMLAESSYVAEMEAGATSPPENTSADSQFAVGAVVAYLDKNHNGKLDLVADDASTDVDQILATNEDFTIVYLQGPILSSFATPGPSGRGPSDGYNLLRQPLCTPAPVAGSSNPECKSAPPPPPPAVPKVCGPMQWLSIDTSFNLTVASSPQVASLMCLTPGSDVGSASGSGGSVPPDPAVQPATYPEPCDPNLSCASDGSDYSYSSCTVISHGLCGGTVSNCTEVGYARPTPAPAGWPCLK